jgi:Flp pilus assembly protein TadD
MNKRPLLLVLVVLSLATLLAAQAGGPLAQADIDRLLAGEVSPARVAALVDQQGLDFDPDQAYLRNLELRSGTERLIESVRTAGRKRILTRADAGLKAQHWAQAEQDYRAALALDPADPQAHAGLGTALVEQNRADAAVPELAQALARDPNNAVAHRSMGMALAQRKEYAGATTELTRARQLDPNDARTWSTLGDVTLEQGDADGAMQDYNQAMKLDPNLQTARLGQARAFDRKGDVAGAETNYRALLALDPRNPRANYGLGGLMERKGNNKDALDLYRTAYTGDPTNDIYRAAYEHMVAITVNISVNVNVPKPIGTGVVHVFRPNRFLGFAGNITLSVDGRPLAKVSNGRYFTLRLKEGTHTFSGDHVTTMNVAVEANHDYYLSIDLGMFGIYLTPTAASKGQSEISKLKPLEADRIYDREEVVEGGGGAPPAVELRRK